ncbi:GntR family transcriptional regulator [Streptomyces sp. ISL-10]|uniref:GntR family transcriptional regulator n=1 Tax=Streptomyces sp. ISL-10 TaxID=2819172 RepID=UPI001BE87907|nr:GntR family transcriptional regulator [Streptomyces sp. ISL-10]MBT2369973.1 GntR family transcriptional regulator [Streptomyces sp. ISL-10]
MTDESIQPYQRIVQDVRDRIRLGHLKGGQKLESTRVLAEKYQVAQGTVQRALAELRTGGIIYSHQGRGSYIRESAAEVVADPTTQAIKRLEEQVADLTTRLERLEHDRTSTDS